MPQYVAVYVSTFQEDLVGLGLSKKSKRVLEKDINLILEKPHHKAEHVKEITRVQLWRKWVCGGKYRIVYRVEENKVTFYTIVLKNEDTYKRIRLVFN
jgi:mRNA-degrading endonuclease RelE of RelBE toxin-antitoxin system